MTTELSEERRQATALAALGVTGDRPLPTRGAAVVGVAGLGAAASVFGVVARLVADRVALAAELAVEPSHLDDRAVRILLLGALVTLVANLLAPGGRRLAARVGLGAVLGIAANVLLATGDAGQLDAVVWLAGAAVGVAVPALVATVASIVDPGPRLVALQLTLAGLPLSFAVAGVLAGGPGDVASFVLAALGLGGLVVAARAWASDEPRDEVVIYALADQGRPELEPNSLGQVMRRLGGRATTSHVIVTSFVLSFVLLAAPLFAMVRLQHDLGVDADALAALPAVAFVLATVLVLAGMVRLGAEMVEEAGAPARPSRWLLGLGALGLVLAGLVDSQPAVIAFAGIGIALGVLVWVRVTYLAIITLTEALRSWALTIFTMVLLVGAPVGLSVAGGVDRRFGTGWALAFLALGLLGVVPSIDRLRSSVDADLLRSVRIILSRIDVQKRVASGKPVPLLEAHNIDFSYGQVQVLFDVDFTVDEGEMVALLGTNGAGKSTLLRVISGLGLPSRGLVRFDGRDITFASPPDRVHVGIAQVPGGKAVFGPLSVVDNLRVHAHALGRDKAAVDRGLEVVFETFPRLAERRNQLAQTLSGGEQQMLALSKALLLQPRLLLIDELSLGLAPVIVGQLLEMVREINRQGTAVVLVEQSVNVALSLAHHAYFMEKGQVRFDGAAKDLLERPEILRSVYLKGAAEGLRGGA